MLSSSVVEAGVVAAAAAETMGAVPQSSSSPPALRGDPRIVCPLPGVALEPGYLQVCGAGERQLGGLPALEPAPPAAQRTLLLRVAREDRETRTDRPLDHTPPRASTVLGHGPYNFDHVTLHRGA